MHPKDLRIEHYTYTLPDEKIARYPLAQRDGSKLLVYQNGNMTESTFAQLDKFIPEGYHLICNNTKVVEARLVFKKETGGRIELFCLEPAPQEGNMALALQRQGECLWICMIGGASKWKPGQTLQLAFSGAEYEGVLVAEYVEKLQDAFLIRFRWSPDKLSFAEVLHVAGQIPLPPYLHREAEPDDAQRYQTLFAKHDGSVAAPTASLHFTSELQAKLEAKQINFRYLTLHVGAGTFKPVKSERLAEHTMHAEYMAIDCHFLHQFLKDWPHTIAVGTTSLRTLESLYWMGVKALKQRTAMLEELEIKQWDSYMLDQNVQVPEAIQALLSWMEAQQHDHLWCTTQLLIAPPYKPRMVKALITNFHQPQSTLLVLVAACIGEANWKKVYSYALENQFRFLSYGDGSLLWVD